MFLETLFKNLSSRLPNPNSLQMKADCVLLRSETDLKNLRTFALAFKDLYNSTEFSRLESEINKIKDDEAFLYRVQRRKNERMMEIWKEFSIEYKNLFRLIQMIQLIPYSNSNIERDFSQLNLVKTPRRNRLLDSTVEAFLLIKQEEKSQIDALYTNDLLQKYRSSPEQKSQNIKFGSTSSQVLGIRNSPRSSQEQNTIEGNTAKISLLNRAHLEQQSEKNAKRPNPIDLPERNDLKLSKLAHGSVVVQRENDQKDGIEAELILQRINTRPPGLVALLINPQ